jgi:hypothetical protein
MMTEWFKRLYDKGEREIRNLEEAKSLAWTLGYDLNYLDGGTIGNPDYDDQMFNRICELVGKTSDGEWPKEVKEAYDDGKYQGWLDT